MVALGLLLVGCMPGDRVTVPDDGTLRLTSQQSSLMVTVPAELRGNVRYLGNGNYFFGEEEGKQHTRVATVAAQMIDSRGLAAFKAERAELSLADILNEYLVEMEPLERASPGRPTNVLLDYAMRGDGRPEHQAQGLVCNERGLVAEDREVPGERGRVFLYHAIYYTCVDPRTRVPVELGWSERYRADTDQLSPTFERDAARYFSSLRFL